MGPFIDCAAEELAARPAPPELSSYADKIESTIKPDALMLRGTNKMSFTRPAAKCSPVQRAVLITMLSHAVTQCIHPVTQS